MNDHPSPQPAPHDPLAVLRGQFPGWEAWRGVSGLLYVRRRMSSPPVVFRGGQPRLLPSRSTSTSSAADDRRRLMRMAGIFYHAGTMTALGIPAHGQDLPTRKPRRGRGNSCPSSESAQRPATPLVTSGGGRCRVPEPRPAIVQRPDIHLHLHGVTAEDVAAIIREQQPAARPAIEED